MGDRFLAVSEGKQDKQRPFLNRLMAASLLHIDCEADLLHGVRIGTWVVPIPTRPQAQVPVKGKAGLDGLQTLLWLSYVLSKSPRPREMSYEAFH